MSWLSTLEPHLNPVKLLARWLGISIAAYNDLGETEDQFANKLQILGQKVISIRPSWKQEANEALKTQFAS